MPSQSPVSYSGGQARPGDVYQSRVKAMPCANSAPLRAEVQTATFGGTTETSYSPTYSRPDGRTATIYYVPAAADSTATLRAASFAALINSHPDHSIVFEATSSGAVVTLTNRIKGRSNTIASVTELTLATATAATSPSNLRPGRLVVLALLLAAASQGVDVAGAQNGKAVKHPALGDFSAMGATITLASIVSGETVHLEVETEEGKFTVSQTFATDVDTTASRLQAKLDAKLTAQVSSASNRWIRATVSGSVITITTQTLDLGAWFSVAANVEGAAATTGTATVAYTTAESGASAVRKALLGFASNAGSEFDITNQIEVLPPYRPVHVEQQADVWAASSASVTTASAVYVGTASGEEGLLYTAAGSGRRKLAASQVRWLSSEATSTFIPGNGAQLARVSL